MKNRNNNKRPKIRILKSKLFFWTEKYKYKINKVIPGSINPFRIWANLIKLNGLESKKVNINPETIINIGTIICNFLLLEYSFKDSWKINAAAKGAVKAELKPAEKSPKEINNSDFLP